jgi:hypothetical protein
MDETGQCDPDRDVDILIVEQTATPLFEKRIHAL